MLPFENLSGDPEQEYFADGLTEDIITELSRFQTFFVIARNSSFTYKGKHVAVHEYPELGMEAIWKIEIQDFPAFIVIDNKGNDFYAELMEKKPVNFVRST